MHPDKGSDDLDDLLSHESEARIRSRLNRDELTDPALMRVRSPAPTAPPLPPRERTGGTGRYIKVITGSQRGTQFSLPDRGALRVGRATDVDARLDDHCVSRNHCLLNVDGKRVTVIDLGSRTGTLVNGQRITGERLLISGDVLLIGETQLQLASDMLDDTADTMPSYKGPAKPAPATPAAPPVPIDMGTPGGKGQSLAGLVNTAMGYFKLGPLLGVSKMGAVFRALDTRDQGPVALKVFVPDFSHSEEEVQRFVRAAKTVMPLRNIHIVDVYNAGRTKGNCWVSMELIEGPSLAWHVQQATTSPTPWKLGMRVLREVTRALIFLHGKQVLHRNLTPKNLLVNSVDGLIKVSDLLVAKAREGELAHSVTLEGHLVGDLHYMAPERTYMDPEAGDARSDLYSLGAVVYAVLTGKPPLDGKTDSDTLEKVRNRVPMPLGTIVPGMPPALGVVVSRLLAKDPAQRFENATELLRHLVTNKLME